jgi:Uri superfamily endonuclease
MMQEPPRIAALSGKRGAYALFFLVERAVRVRVGALGLLRFGPGIWVYVGSATGAGAAGLGHRLRRHFSREKKVHWHIDYLLSGKARPLGALWFEGKRSFECELAASMRDSDAFEAGPPGFGAADCRNRCGTHLFRYAGRGGLRAARARLRALQKKAIWWPGL